MNKTVRSAASQITQAGISFFAIQVLSRFYGPVDFGLVSIFILATTLWLSLHRAAFGEQLIARDGAGFRGYNSFVAAWGGVGVCVAISCVLLSGRPGLLGGALYAVLFVISDALRYSAIALLNHSGEKSWLLELDGARLVLVLGALFCLSVSGGTPIAMLLLLASSAAWILVSGSRFGSVHELRVYLSSLGRFEGLVVLQYVLATGVSQALPLIAIPRLGVSAVGSLRLAASITSPVSLLTTAFQPTLVTMYAKAKDIEAQRRLLRLMLLVVLAIAPLLVLLVEVGVLLLRNVIIVPAQQPAVLSVLLPAAILTAFVPLGQPGGALIRVRRLGKTTFFGQLAGVVVGLPICLLALESGLTAFAWSLTISSAATVIASYFLLWAGIRRLAS